MNLTEAKNVRPSLDALAKEWVDAKAAETALRDRRLRIESEMLKQIPVKLGGNTTEKTEHYMIMTVSRLQWSVDWTAYDWIKEQIPETLRPVGYAPKLDTKRLKWLEQNEPAIYRELAHCISAKPQKVGFQIRPLKGALADTIPADVRDAILG